MKKHYSLLILFSVLTLSASGCKTPPPPEVSYSAKVVITTAKDAKPSIIEGQIAQKGKNLRIEGTTMGEYVVTIIRPDLNKTYLIYPNKKSYVEKAIEPDKDYGVWLSSADSTIKVERVKVGAERIEGHIAGIYKVTMTDTRTKETRVSTYWEAQDLGGVPLKIELDIAGGKMSYLMKDISLTAAPELFEVPKDYRKI